jgi:hypothetical protein
MKTTMLKRFASAACGLALAAIPMAVAQTPTAPVAAKADAGVNDTAKKVYVITLDGIFGEDISQTPIRQAVKDAKAQDADVIIFILENDWSVQGAPIEEERKDDEGNFDELFRAEEMETTFTEEIENSWTKQPQVVFWVKKAMGGAAFLPFNCKTIYFSSEAKMGGIGHLNRQFGQMGDQVVREKQFSLRLGHAEGRAIKGGYAPQIIRAMARDEYILSYSMSGGSPVFHERMPESDTETLLTDDGKDDREDTIQLLARGEGNDCLTLTPKLAYDLGISRGTVDSMQDLIFQLGLARDHVMLKARSPQIMKSWKDGIAKAKRDLPRLWREYNQVQVAAPGGYQQRNQARGKRTAILNEMLAIIRRYEEAVNPNAVRAPNASQIETIKKSIELERLQDRDR